MHRLSRVAAPAVWLLRISTEAVLRALRLSGTRSETITEDEVKSLIAEGTRAGVFVPQERRMIEGVLRLADRPVRVVMTPRTEITWVDIEADGEALLRAVARRRFSRLLVCEDSVDNAVGILHTKDVLPLALKNEPIAVRAAMVPAVIVPDRTSVLQLLDRFRREGVWGRTPRGGFPGGDIQAGGEALRRAVARRRCSRRLVCEDSVDNAVGILHTKDVLPLALKNEPIAVRAAMVPAVIVPDRTSVLQLLDRFRREGIHMAVMVDEYGTTEGIATLTDVLESIAGDLPERGELTEPLIVRRSDGSWLVAGTPPLHRFEDRFSLTGMHGDGGFHTLAGFVLHRLGHVPDTGESLDYRGLRFAVVDMDGRRVD